MVGMINKALVLLLAAPILLVLGTPTPEAFPPDFSGNFLHNCRPTPMEDYVDMQEMHVRTAYRKFCKEKKDVLFTPDWTDAYNEANFVYSPMPHTKIYHNAHAGISHFDQIIPERMSME
ncbi:MAG: hypothetical protein LQ351_005220 [Letrouitia transgressa]|nr:MAG: hypothetical protein LQ351_005220 [Letrouitia transgressa]